MQYLALESFTLFSVIEIFDVLRSTVVSPYYEGKS